MLAQAPDNNRKRGACGGVVTREKERAVTTELPRCQEPWHRSQEAPSDAFVSAGAFFLHIRCLAI